MLLFFQGETPTSWAAVWQIRQTDFRVRNIVHPSLSHTAHRPWPLPDKSWRWRLSWRNLAYIHFRIEADSMRGAIPPDLEIQEFDGSAWVGIVPFLMVNMMPGYLPGIWPLRRFPELNVRTYVKRDGRPGVWFFSLDADCLPLVLGARFLYGLPYYKARMRLAESGGSVEFKSSRRGGDADFHASYRPTGPVFYAEKTGFEHWVAERYCLYSSIRQKTLRLDIHHRPWPLQRAEVDIHNSDLLKAAGLAPGDGNPVCHYSSGVDVVSYPPG